MPEAEVSLRLAFYLLGRPESSGTADVAIDGAQVGIAGTEVFPLVAFLAQEGWSPTERTGRWQGVYGRGDHRLRIHSRPGLCDVVTTVAGARIRAECKGGPLTRQVGSKEYRSLWAALGQLIAISEVTPDDLIVAAVPDAAGFRALVTKWRQAPLITKAGIRLALVSRSGAVDGL
jgi:hypothetical protein